MTPSLRSLLVRSATTVALACLSNSVLAQPKAPSPACPAILQHQFNRLQDEAPQDLCQFAGKVILVVNTASYCGFTHQYEGLEKLFARYRQQGLVVLGFPSNDFGQQEPGSAQAIADLCFNTYAVRFPMFSKTVVAGPKRNALYAGLVKATGVGPAWNFHKYLIDRNGTVVGQFASQVEPLAPAIVNAVDKALRTRP
jgi:glutathione peroxidase